MIASEYIFFEDLLWDALNARLFLLVTKENTSVEWKQAIGCRVAQVANGATPMAGCGIRMARNIPTVLNFQKHLSHTFEVHYNAHPRN